MYAGQRVLEPFRPELLYPDDSLSRPRDPVLHR